jgi:MFS family permease
MLYTVSVPIWEADNEDGHFAYARYLAVRRTLLQPGDPEAQQIWEAFQPPLYYALIAPALLPFDLGETFQPPERNPYLAHGNAGVNYALHPDRLEGAARQTWLAVHVARALGALISTLSVIFVYRAARRVWPGPALTAWTATALYAFWPQFLFTGSMVTNDVLVTALAAAAFYLSIALVADRFRLRRALLLGLVAGCALVTKLNAAALVPMAGAAILISLSRGISWRSPRLWLTLAGLAAALAAALWALSSLEFVTRQIFQAATLREFLRTLPNIAEVKGQTGSNLVLAYLGYGFRTFLASYGWGNLETYPWLYRLWPVGAGAALLGLLAAALTARRRELMPIRLLALLGLLVVSMVGMALALAIAHQNVYIPGRYFLAGLPAVAFLLVEGWRMLVPRRFARFVWKTLGVGVVVVGWSIPFLSLMPAYAKPQPLAANAAVDHPLSIFIGDEIELIGYRRPESILPGEDFHLSLCWRAVAPVRRNYSVFLEIIGPDGQGYGRLETYPGKGNYATTLWTVNTRFCEEYTLAASKDVPAPAAARVAVWLLDGVLGEPLPARDASGADIGFASLPVKVRSTAPVPALANPVAYQFGNGIALTGYEIQSLAAGAPRICVRLRWEAKEDIHEDYTVFVHLRTASPPAYAQGDSRPVSGWYPTSLWQKGEAVLDEHCLQFPADAPASPLDLYVGLYTPATVTRLPVFDAQGNPVPNDEVRLAAGLSFP